MVWGPPVRSVRFGIEVPTKDVEAGGTIRLTLLCENASSAPIQVFGFVSDYPRSLRVSPPKSHRPYIRVSFGDVNVLHPPEAFVTIAPGEVRRTDLDLSFAFDRRGAGRWPIAFAYDPVRSRTRQGWLEAGDEAPQSAVANLLVSSARSLREAGITEETEEALDMALLRGDGDLADQLRGYGEGGLAFAARRVARILSSGTEASLGWRALEALSLIRADAVAPLQTARAQLPHAEAALGFAEDWLRHRCGEDAPAHHLPFVTMLDRIIDDRASRGNFLLSWTSRDSAVHGTQRLQLLGSGERIVSHRAPGESVARTRRLSLTELQMDTVAEALRYAAVWLLRPLREGAMPDEPRPTLEVQLALGDPFVHSVAMWNGEWRQGPASALADLLDRLSAFDGRSASRMPPPA
ncbi:MAG: hypothetical protein AAF411_31060 [Myxococcota bacterium]